MEEDGSGSLLGSTKTKSASKSRYIKPEYREPKFDTDNNAQQCCHMGCWRMFLIFFELSIVITSIVMSSIWLAKSIDQRDAEEDTMTNKSNGYGNYPWAWSRASGESVTDGRVNLGIYFFGLGLLVSGGLVFLLLAISSIRYYADKTVQTPGGSPIGVYVKDLLQMTNWFDGVRHSLSIWVFNFSAIIICGERGFIGLFYISALTFISYFLRVLAGIERKDYANINGDGAQAAKARSRSKVALQFLIGLAIQITTTVVILVAYKYRKDDPTPKFNYNERAFVILSCAAQLAEYWFVFGMRSSVVLQDAGKEDVFDVTVVAAYFLSLTWVWMWFSIELRGILSYILSRAIEINLWILCSIFLYTGAVYHVEILV